MTVNQKIIKHVKVLFELDSSHEHIDVESVWALPVTNGYQIDNIPFYAKEVACNDVISAEPDEDGALRFKSLIAASGHSTIRLWFSDEKDVPRVRNELRDMGCVSELDLPRLVAVDIPPSVAYGKIRAYLEQQESKGIFEYEEACLGQD